MTIGPSQTAGNTELNDGADPLLVPRVYRNPERGQNLPKVCGGQEAILNKLCSSIIQLAFEISLGKSCNPLPPLSFVFSFSCWYEVRLKKFSPNPSRDPGIP